MISRSCLRMSLSRVLVARWEYEELTALLMLLLDHKRRHCSRTIRAI